MLDIDHIQIDPAYADRLRAVGLDRVDRILNWTEGRICAWSRSTDTMHIPAGDGLPGFYLKRYRFLDWNRRIRCTFRGSFFGEPRAAAEYRLLRQMRQLGIPAVRPIAVGCRRRLQFVVGSFLITEEVPDAQNLTSFARSLATGRVALGVAARRAFVGRLARQIAEIHVAGFQHGQLFWRNVLVRMLPTGEAEFYFLDARPRHTVRRLSRLGRNWWIEELAHMAASAEVFTNRSERLRFLIAYYKARGVRVDLAEQIGEIEALRGKWARHEAQRVRMGDRFDEWNRRLAEEIAAEIAPAATGDGV